MSSSSTRFIILVFVLTAFCAALQYVWNSHAAPNMVVENGYWLLGIFAISVTLVHLLLLKFKKEPGAAFIRAFMLATTLKFFFYLGVMTIFIVFLKDNKVPAAIAFLIYYFAFNALEISLLYSEVRKK